MSMCWEPARRRQIGCGCSMRSMDRQPANCFSMRDSARERAPWTWLAASARFPAGWQHRSGPWARSSRQTSIRISLSSPNGIAPNVTICLSTTSKPAPMPPDFPMKASTSCTCGSCFAISPSPKKFSRSVSAPSPRRCPRLPGYSDIERLQFRQISRNRTLH